MNYSFYDEMDELNEILTETTDEEIFLETMMDLLGFNDPKYGVFTEKKSSVEYALKRFKEHYHYDPENSTITVRGKEYKVDFKIKNDVYHNGDKWSERELEAVINGPDKKIVLDNKFFKLKNDKRRDALLEHELTHMTLHSEDPSSKYLDTDTISPRKITRKDVERSKKETREEEPGISDSERKLRRLNGIVKRAQLREQAKPLVSKSTASDEMDKARDNAAKLAESHIPKHPEVVRTTHVTDPDEYEADARAVNRTGGPKHLKAALRESNKHMKSEKEIRRSTRAQRHANELQANNVNPNTNHIPPLSKEGKRRLSKQEVENRRKDQNIRSAEDMKYRARAIKDTKLITNPAIQKKV